MVSHQMNLRLAKKTDQPTNQLTHQSQPATRSNLAIHPERSVVTKCQQLLRIQIIYHHSWPTD